MNREEIIKLAREAGGLPDPMVFIGAYERFAALVAAEQPVQQEPVATIRALTDQCAALIQERDELQKQVWRYEKNGVTCQTYQHKIDRTCSECNVQENYTSPQTSKPPTQDMVKSCPYYSETLRGAFFDGWIKAEAAHGIKEKNNGHC